jgi:hypothetical protein
MSYVYTAFTPVSKDTTEVAVGLSVHSLGPEEEGIKFLELPAAGRLLVGSYTGSYSQMGELYRVMDQYMGDKRLRKVAMPMEKRPFPSGANGICGNSGMPKDSQDERLELAYPIY